MSQPNRPLSPHLQVYRPQLTSLLSISHRATGVTLALGTALLAWWLGAAAYGPAAYAKVQGFMGSWLGVLILMGFSFSLFYHLCNGIRHLLWDAGWGFEIEQTYRSGYTVLAASGGLTLLSWIVGFSR